MARIPSFCTLCLIVGTVILLVRSATAVPVTSFGPGVAGQIHALAFVEDDSETVYVGGDTFGVCKTTDLGGEWTYWNRGLENQFSGKSMYVEDLAIMCVVYRRRYAIASHYSV